LLIFANKQDLPNAMSVDEVANRLELGEITNNWHIQGSVAESGEGLREGLEWLATAVKNNIVNKERN
jgi:ADP-ribosylation factor protein 1